MRFKYNKAKSYAFPQIRDGKYSPQMATDIAALKFDLSSKQRERLLEECLQLRSTVQPD